MAALDDLVGLADVIGAVRGSSRTTTQRGGTTTQRQYTDVSDAGVQELINQILAGPGGVQSIGGAARRSGLYDSTTEEMLLGDLFARAAVQGELARSPTITETTTPDMVATVEQPGIGLGTLAGTLGATALAAPVVDRISSGISGGMGNILGAIGLGGRGGSAAASAGAAIPGGFMTQLATGPASLASGAAPGIGSFLSGLQGGRLDPVSVGSSIVSGALMGGPLGAGLGAVSTIFGGGLGRAARGTVICTALMKRGLLDEALYQEGLEYLYEMPEATRVGYHFWACGVADKIEAGNKFWTVVCLPFATGRTKLLATEGTVLAHVRHPLGTLTKYVGEPICWMIGKAILARKAWETTNG